MTTTETGRKGEQLIHELLPSSEWINADKDQQLPYDIVWEGIKIDVKFTSRILGNKKQGCLFAVRLNIRSNGAVIVLVAQQDDLEYFWVEKASRNTTNYFKVKD